VMSTGMYKYCVLKKKKPKDNIDTLSVLLRIGKVTLFRAVTLNLK